METSGGWGNGRSSRMTGLMCVSLVIFYCDQEEPLIYNSQASIFFDFTSTVYGFRAVFRADR